MIFLSHWCTQMPVDVVHFHNRQSLSVKTSVVIMTDKAEHCMGWAHIFMLCLMTWLLIRFFYYFNLSIKGISFPFKLPNSAFDSLTSGC